jgi:hypothetical protein
MNANGLDLTTETGRTWKRIIDTAIAADAPKPTEAKAAPAHVTGQTTKTEAAFARKLDGMKAAGQVREYWFERVKLRLNVPGEARACWYTVDYVILNADGTRTFAEVKGGHIWEDSVIKWKWAAHEFAAWGRWEMWQRVKGEFNLIHYSVRSDPRSEGRQEGRT